MILLAVIAVVLVSQLSQARAQIKDLRDEVEYAHSRLDDVESGIESACGSRTGFGDCAGPDKMVGRTDALEERIDNVAETAWEAYFLAREVAGFPLPS